MHLMIRDTSPSSASTQPSGKQDRLAGHARWIALQSVSIAGRTRALFPISFSVVSIEIVACMSKFEKEHNPFFLSDHKLTNIRRASPYNKTLSPPSGNCSAEK